MIVAWTGHRADLFRDPPAARMAVTRVASELASEYPERVHFRVGGQRGVDTWAALAARALDVPYTVILPLPPEQFVDEHWSAADRQQLADVLSGAAEVRTIGGARVVAFTERNRALIAGADLLVAVWTATRGGGTAETIDLARAAGVHLREVRLETDPDADSAIGRGI